MLHEIVLRNLREAIAYVSEHEAEFAQEAAESDMRDRDAEFVRKRETLAKADARIAELDRIISRLYEDNVIGKLSDERFIKMSHDYELEQSNLKSMAEVLRKDLKQQEQQKTNVKEFIAAVKKYTDLQELDAAVLRAFIDRIEVSHDNIFFRRQNWKQIKLLKNKSNPFTAECRQFLIAVTVNIFTIVGQRAGRWLIQAGKQMQQGTFSASRWPHNGNKIAGYNFEICTIQSHHSVFTVTINL